MARKRVSENPVVVSGAAAAPARRKPAVKRTTRPTVEIPGTNEVTPAPIETEPVVAEVPVAVAKPADQEIAKLAYSFWVARGYQGGSPEEDWLRAEQQLAVSLTK